MVENNLIFLVSQPRSGSTLLQKLLFNHPEIYTVGEPWILLPGLCNNFAGKIENKNPVYGKFTANRAIVEFNREYYNSSEVNKEALKAYYLKKYELIINDQEGKRFFLDKTPRYYLIINEILELFPNSKIIILLRNPLSVLNSIIYTWTKRNNLKLGLFKKDLLDSLSIFSNLINNNSQNTIYFVHYEDLVNDTELEVSKILKFLNLECNNIKEMVGEINNKKWALGDPVNIYKYKTVTKENVNSWQINLRNRRFRNLAESYLDILGEEIFQNLGYDFWEMKKIIRSSKNSIECPSPGLKFYFNPISITLGRATKLIDAFINKIRR